MVPWLSGHWLTKLSVTITVAMTVLLGYLIQKVHSIKLSNTLYLNKWALIIQAFWLSKHSVSSNNCTIHIAKCIFFRLHMPVQYIWELLINLSSMTSPLFAVKKSDIWKNFIHGSTNLNSVCIFLVAKHLSSYHLHNHFDMM